ncbi:MAG: glycogen/starch/alpha-glucan phosphorylase, partial [Gammaproteobacteria bacterium]
HAAGYVPRQVYLENAQLRAAVDLIASGHFSGGDAALFQPVVTMLLEHDPFLALADYASYIACQEAVAHARRDLDQWARRSILNVARIGRFSSDRAVSEYCRDIWHVMPQRRQA